MTQHTPEAWLVRPATPGDAEVIWRLTRAAFAGQAGLDPPSGASRETLEQVAADLESAGGLLATDPVSGQPVGAARWRVEQPAPWVRRVAVPPAHRRRGVGRELMLAAARHAAASGWPALRVGVRTGLAGNLDFYARLGYVPVADHDHWQELALFLPRQVATPADMRLLGRAVAEAARPGDLLLLDGPLGAGKTVFVQGLAAGLGCPGVVTSPTFILARRYDGGRVALLHVDAYRLGSAAELDDIDLATEDALTVVEWGRDRAEGLAEAHLTVELTRSGPGEDRTIGFRPCGGDWAARLLHLELPVC